MPKVLLAKGARGELVRKVQLSLRTKASILRASTEPSANTPKQRSRRFSRLILSR
jgi:hypothetical protein